MPVKMQQYYSGDSRNISLATLGKGHVTARAPTDADADATGGDYSIYEQDGTPHLDRHLDQDSDFDVVLHSTTPRHTQNGRATQSASIGHPQRRHGQSCLAPNTPVLVY